MAQTATQASEFAKLHIPSSFLAQQLLSAEMPSPPAYDTVVDPSAPIPNLRNPYDPELDSDLDSAEDIPEVTVNATTQIRGHANIISTPPVDATRVAGLLYNLMYGGAPPHPSTASSASTPTLASPQDSVGLRTRMSPLKINITVNCGATIVGDKNIVGSGLNDIARQMQMANKTRPNIPALMTQASQAGQASQGAMPTPPMSRNPSTGSESDARGALKRKAEGEADGAPDLKKMEGYC
ncbi:hypothetical protein K491DRAFT_596702 [Lophiostoma macrostomum CBS 122681]|uniref:Uncharacterized protein n=1 Tax=Lophiostoma macrostomum CBS 122681 TaxID=1314788 RepID=A0A6A6T9T1_9PLEO|nr:hypothetical protein K491DRAFT_596702 [Lophiostoma macrostomum CBS 122681]